MTYTLLEIHRINDVRTKAARFKPQPGKTMTDLDRIRDNELKKLVKKHPGHTDQLEVFLVYIEETIKKPKP